MDGEITINNSVSGEKSIELGKQAWRYQKRFMREDLCKKRIIVVDDSMDTLHFAEFILKNHGVDVETAGTATYALKLLHASAYDLLLSDIRMPEIDGYRFIRLVRDSKNKYVKNIIAVALTAYAQGEERRKIMAAGYQGYISKPVSPNNLISSVTSFLGGA